VALVHAFEGAVGAWPLRAKPCHWVFSPLAAGDAILESATGAVAVVEVAGEAVAGEAVAVEEVEGVGQVEGVEPGL
jgi:hypothetical protein